MPYRTASVVGVLNRYLPFDAASGGLYEEFAPQASDAPPSYRTPTLDFVLKALEAASTRLVLLTGDAGHGKTHLCRRVLELGGGFDDDTARAHLLAGDGSQRLNLPRIGRRLRLVKDLSDKKPPAGARLLEDLLTDEDSVGLVCVNEGHLRAIVAESPDHLVELLDGLEESIAKGVTESTLGVRIVNLNYQAAAPPGGGFLDHLISAWLGDGRRWTACRQCDASDGCPILSNQERLTAQSGAKDALLQVVRVAEQSGYVLTYREALFLVSYLVTGGLDCGMVAEIHSRRRGDLRDFDLVELLFERTLAAAEAKNLRVLSRLRTYDPGLLPIRTVDEALLRESGESDLDTTADGQTRAQRKRAARRLRDEMRVRRRRAFFGEHTALDDDERALRLGLRGYSDFVHVQSDDENPTSMRIIVERVVRGLHVIQGVRVDDRSSLYLVDPAFTRAGCATSVIAATVPKNQLWLYGLHEYWLLTGEEGTRVDLIDAVDWLDREIVLCRGRDKPTELLRLDLLQFEYVVRSADGSSFPAFHAADRRRILARLAKFAESSAEASAEIRFVSLGGIRTLTLEQDGSVEVHHG
ncbi:hypothetical protein V3331_14580 [Gaopeijia maritima]|uniref:hypothetical protein n=1 Tax=Gaopeijia maritima TaxID=3119007 RepID=UPI0032565A35